MESTLQTDDVINTEMNKETDVENEKNIVCHEDDEAGNVKAMIIPNCTEQEEADILANEAEAKKIAPEVYHRTSMLFIECIVNGHSVRALVDTGASNTFMSMDCAKRCGIGHLVDTSCRTKVSDASSVKANLGFVHYFPLKIVDSELLTTFSIMPLYNNDLIIGLATLKRYSCTLHLEGSKLFIPTTSSVISFLEETERRTESVNVTTHQHNKVTPSLYQRYKDFKSTIKVEENSKCFGRFKLGICMFSKYINISWHMRSVPIKFEKKIHFRLKVGNRQSCFSCFMSHLRMVVVVGVWTNDPTIQVYR